MDSGTPDALDTEIAEKAAAIAAKERALEIARAELGALQRAAALRPIGQSKGHYFVPSRVVSDIVGHANARGKAKGTLSNQWRQIMAAVVANGNAAAVPEAWTETARQCGYKLDVRAVRDWLKRGVGMQMGFIERQGDAFCVSEVAILKFGFPIPEGQPLERRPFPWDQQIKIDERATEEEPL